LRLQIAQQLLVEQQGLGAGALAAAAGWRLLVYERQAVGQWASWRGHPIGVLLLLLLLAPSGDGKPKSTVF
jgi:hypothetical protein